MKPESETLNPECVMFSERFRVEDLLRVILGL